MCNLHALESYYREIVRSRSAGLSFQEKGEQNLKFLIVGNSEAKLYGIIISSHFSRVSDFMMANISGFEEFRLLGCYHV
jgi:hypothetical protein